MERCTRPRRPPALILFAALLAAAAAAPTTTATSSSSSLPLIDFASLGSVSVVGDFQGLDFYDPSSSTLAHYSSTASTLVSRSSDGTLAPLGTTNDGGTINAICQTPAGTVFVGGSFTSFGGVATSNIASYDPGTRSFGTLSSGVNGAVLALSCNGTEVYVGGDFASPVGGTGYGGNVASWSTTTQSWLPMPFHGLNGPVESIAPSPDGKSLFFGGSFTTSFINGTVGTTVSTSTTRTTTNISLVGNGTIFASLGSSLVPISLNASDFVASPTTYTSGFGRPQYVFCPRRQDGVAASWLLVDGEAGSFIVREYRPLRVRGIRLGNTFFEGRGTKNFSLTSIPDNTVLTLQYASNPADPTSELATCRYNCNLAHDPDVPYQDFLFNSTITMTGFELDIFGWYGAAGGLHLLQLLSEGAYDYAVASNNLSPCAAGLGASVQSGVATTGTWARRSVVSSIAGTTQSVLYGHLTNGAAAPTLTWTPTVIQDGTYNILFYTPACEQQGDCSLRTSVSVAVTPPGGATTTTVINQSVGANNVETSIFTGNLLASVETGGGVTVVVTLSGTVAANSGKVIVADMISLVAASTNGSTTSNSTTTTNSTTYSNTTATGNGLFEFALSGLGTFGDAVAASENLDALGTLQNGTHVDQLSFALSMGANVSAVVSVGTGTATRVFVGGLFEYSTPTGAASSNIVSYSGPDSAVIVAPNGGLNGQVVSLVELDGVLYAAGVFTGSSDGNVTNLGGVAMWHYTTPGTSWQALSGTIPSVTGSIAALGVVNSGANSTIVAVGGGGSGLAFISPAAAAWNASADVAFFVGNLTAFSSAPSVDNASAPAYFAGLVAAASSNAVPGGALLSSTNGVPKITALEFDLSSSGGVTSNATVAKRSPSLPSFRFAPRSGADALAPRVFSSLATASPPVNTTLPSALTSDAAAEILAGAYWKNTMVLGGKFVTSTGITNVGMFDVTTRKLSALPGETISGTVSTIAIANDVAWIGGSFSTATGRQGLTTYDLQTLAVSDVPPALEGYTGSQATVNVIIQRPGYQNTVIVGGAFASAGTVACQSICSWDSKLLQWSTLSIGLPGVVGAISFAGGNSEYLIAAGSFLINGTSAYLAQWSYADKAWTVLGNSSDIPGPATAVTADGTNDSKIFIAGTSLANAPYLMYWNGTSWTDVSDGALQSGSGVQQLVFVPLAADHNSNSIVESDRMLMVSGDLTINSTSVSSALFDGSSWYPYLVASSASGSGVMTQLFYSATDFTLSAKHMAVGLVILISIAIALGVVFLVVLLGLLVALARRSEPSAYPVQPPTAREADEVHVLHRPTSLLAAVGAATAVMLDSKGEKPGRPLDHDSIAGPMSFEGNMSLDSNQFEDTAARARYSFHAEHVGELSVSAGEELVILECSDANWYLVANSSGQRGLMPASYLT